MYQVSYITKFSYYHFTVQLISLPTLLMFYFIHVVQYTIFLENIAIWDVTPLRLPQIKVQRHIFPPFFHFSVLALLPFLRLLILSHRSKTMKKISLPKRKKCFIILGFFILQVPGYSLFSSGLYP